MKWKTKHTTQSDFQNSIRIRGEIDIPKTNIHDCSLSWFGIYSLIKKWWYYISFMGRVNINYYITINKISSVVN